MEPLKVAFVPTAGLRKDWLRAETIERLEITHDMYAKRVINGVFLSAKDTADERTAIEMMREWLARRDVPPESIVCDATTPSGGERSLPLVHFLKRTSYTPPAYLYVVTGWYHMPRCVRQIKERLRQFGSQLPSFRGRTAVITRVKTATPVIHCVALVARKGMLIRNFSAFERVETLDTLVLDKTGTVTRGDWRLQGIILFGEFTAEKSLALASGLEQEVSHPIALEILREARERRIRPERVAVVQNEGNGMSGLWEGVEVKIGGAAEFVAEEFSGQQPLLATVHMHPADRSRVYLAAGGRPAAVLLFGDRLREGVEPVVTDLQRRGLL